MSSHAEVERVWPRDGRIRVTGRVHGHGRASGPWKLLLVQRRHAAQRLRYDATLDGDAFDAAVPVDDLALDGLPRATWNLHLACGTDADAELFRLGRHLDDIRDKKGIFVFPRQTVTSDEVGTLVRPYYTRHDNLSVECVPGDAEPRPDAYAFEDREWAGSR
jgi:hypothetical protein